MDFIDPYIDQDTGLLKNLLGAKSHEELQEREAQVVFANELELESLDISRTNDFIEVLAIHRQLFRDVFDWAGEIRTVDIKKHGDNSEFFLPVSKINDAAQYVFRKLDEQNNLKELAMGDFVKKLSYFYDHLNYIHPFREGNGRTQRVFWSRVARDAGYEINWDQITGDENDEASRMAAEDMDTSGLEKMFDKIIAPLP